MDKLISIVITVYNKEIYLGHCFTLLNEQLLKLNDYDRNKIELIVIDDCSTDNSIRLIKSILDSKIEYRLISNTERKNIAYVRWQAVNEVKGKYFIFIDADDLISENYISSLLEINYKVPADVFQFKGREYPNGVLMDYDCTWMPLKLFRTGFVRKHNINFNKEYPISVGDIAGGEDLEFYNLFCSFNPVIYNIPYILVTWNFAVPNSLTKYNHSFDNFISKE